MKKIAIAAAMALALPAAAQAQSLQPGGFYIGAEGGINWLLNTSSQATVSVPGVGFGSFGTNLSTNLGWTAGGMIGYDFIGPRVELEARFIQNTGTLTVPGTIISTGATVNQVPIMANLFTTSCRARRGRRTSAPAPVSPSRTCRSTAATATVASNSPTRA